jgi:hypothetical protein
MRVVITPEDWEHADALAALALCAAMEHGLPVHLDALHLVLDAPSPDDHPWLERRGERALAVYVHPDRLRSDQDAGLIMEPTSRPWELARRPDAPRAERFSTPHAERFLHHVLLSLADLLEGRIRPDAVPADLTEAFQEAWDVTLDGRLRGRSLPGLPVAERRRRFFRTFSGSGCLLPRHWEIFHELWENADPTHETIAAQARGLPPLTGRYRK